MAVCERRRNGGQDYSAVVPAHALCRPASMALQYAFTGCHVVGEFEVHGSSPATGARTAPCVLKAQIDRSAAPTCVTRKASDAARWPLLHRASPWPPRPRHTASRRSPSPCTVRRALTCSCTPPRRRSTDSRPSARDGSPPPAQPTSSSHGEQITRLYAVVDGVQSPT